MERDDVPDHRPGGPVPDGSLGGRWCTSTSPSGQTCVVSGLIFARPSPLGGTTVGVLDSSGTIVLDRVIVPNGDLTISNCTDVILEQVHVRQLPGDIPPVAGVTITNSWVQANDLDATGGNVTAEPNFFAAAGSALEVFDNATVALARPKLIGGFGGGPWISSPSTPAGGIAIRASNGGIVSIADDVGSSSYLVGGQGGMRGIGSSPSIPSGNGGNALEADLAGSITNKKPMRLFGGAPGGNAAGGPVGAFGATAATFTNGVYQAITDLPCVYRHVSGSVPGGFFLFSHHAAAPLLPVAVAIMPDIDLDLYPPSLQFRAGNPLSAVLLFVGQANAIGYFEFGTALQPGMSSAVGVSVVIQTADDTANTLFLANPSMFVLGF